MKLFLFSFLVLLFSILSGDSWAVTSDADRAEVAIKNLLADKNPGFENGVHGWTASGGTFTRVTSGSNFMGIGRANATWDSNSASQTLRSSAYTIPNGIAGTQGVVRCKIYAASGTPTHTIGTWDGTTYTNTTTLPAVLTTAQYVYSTPFTFGAAATTIAIELSSVASDEPLVSIDDCGIYGADGVAIYQVSQASFYGSIKWAQTANCSWNSTATTATAFAADSDCPAPTVTGQVSAPGTKVPGLVITGPGEFQIVMAGARYLTSSNTDGITSVKLSDGTNNSSVALFPTIATSGDTESLPSVATFHISLSSGGAVTLNQYVDTGAGTINLRNQDTSYDGSGLSYYVYKFPVSTQIGYGAGGLPASWSGYHDNTCSFARTNTAYGDPATDASCGLTERNNRNFGTVTGANNLPSITFTPARAGMFHVCAHVSIQGATAGSNIAAKLWDGTTTITERDWNVPVNAYGTTLDLCGNYNATSTAAKTLSIQTKSSTGAVTIAALTAASAIEWNLTSLDQTFPGVVVGTAPTVQRFTTGNNTYTVPSGVRYLKVLVVGAGGGGGGNTNNGNNGGDTTFGNIVAKGGLGGQNNGVAGLGGGANTISGSNYLALENTPGGSGYAVTGTASGSGGGGGGVSCLGGGATGGTNGVQNAQTPTANSGSGGGGAQKAAASGEGGGGAGGCVRALITAPLAATYTANIGTGGGGGSGTAAGSSGADGVIIVEEYYQ